MIWKDLYPKVEKIVDKLSSIWCEHVLGLGGQVPKMGTAIVVLPIARWADVSEQCPQYIERSLHKASRVVMVVEPLRLAPGHGHAEVQKTHNYNCPLDKAVRSPHDERLGSSALSLLLFTMNL